MPPPTHKHTITKLSENNLLPVSSSCSLFLGTLFGVLKRLLRRATELLESELLSTKGVVLSVTELRRYAFHRPTHTGQFSRVRDRRSALGNRGFSLFGPCCSRSPPRSAHSWPRCTTTTNCSAATLTLRFCVTWVWVFSQFYTSPCGARNAPAAAKDGPLVNG